MIALVEMAFDAAEKTAQDDWEINISRRVETTAENQERIEQMLDILSGVCLAFVQIANFERMPGDMQKLLDEGKAERCTLP